MVIWGQLSSDKNFTIALSMGLVLRIFLVFILNMAHANTTMATIKGVWRQDHY